MRITDINDSENTNNPEDINDSKNTNNLNTSIFLKTSMILKISITQ
ncbi:10917_t:CDS:2 [Cetraspora pellucida]|uniref:10917_t:CDS:1 n=1 Tax=Cetraspora pellucida TaxID=1433469 RepID=A0A9N9H538_9GLOM|nr:10917_t:CDS:2 [Cetraspora pellucida]